MTGGRFTRGLFLDLLRIASNLYVARQLQSFNSLCNWSASSPPSTVGSSILNTVSTEARPLTYECVEIFAEQALQKFSPQTMLKLGLNAFQVESVVQTLSVSISVIPRP